MIEALKSDNVIKEISDAIVNTISRKFAEKLIVYQAKKTFLEAEIQIFKSNADKSLQEFRRNHGQISTLMTDEINDYFIYLNS